MVKFTLSLTKSIQRKSILIRQLARASSYRRFELSGVNCTSKDVSNGKRINVYRSSIYIFTAREVFFPVLI